MDTSLSSLSSSRQYLVEKMQRIGFGRIENLNFFHGEPIFDPKPSYVLEKKLAGDNGPWRELGDTDYLLKQQVIGLFEFIDEECIDTIDVLEIKHGLPFRIITRSEYV